MTRANRKPTRKPTRKTRRAAISLSGLLLDTLQRGAEALSHELDLIIAGAAEENGHDKGSRIGHTLRNVVAVLDGVRKDEAANRKRGAELNRTDIVAWARTIETAERGHLVRELQAIDGGGGSVLG